MNKFSLSVFYIILFSFTFLPFKTTKANSLTVLENEKSTLRGTITDKNSSQPLSGATIFIPDLKLGTISDSAGNYSFKNLPSGTFLIEIKFQGYKSITRNIVLKGIIVYENFKLEESAAEINEVVVTGTSKATQIKRNPVPIVSVSHDYLVTNLNTNAIDAIAKVPGIRAVTTGPNISKPFIRGLGFNRILTLYDGVRQEGQQWGEEHGIEVDQYGIDKVEIIKGPASLSYGSDALAGVVNLIPTQPAQEGKLIADITTDYQTNNKYFGGSAMISTTKNGLELLARISHKQATNYQNKIDGRVFGTAFNETDANASIGIHRKWGYSHIHFVLYDDIQEIPDGSRDSATWKFTRQIKDNDSIREIVSDADLNGYKIDPIHQHIQHLRIFSANNFILKNGTRLMLNLGFQKSIRREFNHPEIPYQNVPGLFLQLNSFNYDIKYSLNDIKSWNITLGINGMYQQNTVTNGTEFIIPSYHQFDFGTFVTAKKTFGKLDIAGGLRYDIRTFNNDELYHKENPVNEFDIPVFGADTIGAKISFYKYSNTFSGVSGSIGATYNFTDKLSLKANVSRGFRTPNISEITSNGVHPGSNIYQIGNDNFKPEFSLQQDIGFVFSSNYARIEFNIFNNFINNYIYNQKLIGANGLDSVVVSGKSTYKFISSRAHLFGGEISVDLHPYKFIHFENSLSVVYAQNKGIIGNAVPDSEKYLPFIPPLHGISELRFDFDAKSLKIKHGFVKLQMEYYANQNRIYSAYGTETKTPGYTLFNAGIGGSFINKLNKTICSIYLMANNLFDADNWDHLSRLKYFYGNYKNPTATDNSREHGIYGMGKNISLKIDFPFNYFLKKVS